MSLQKEYANRKMAKRSIDSYKKEVSIHDACEEGDLDTVLDLITTSPSEIWKTDEMCYFSGLHVASNFGHLELVKVLLDAGSDINRKSKSGETPLHLAVLKNHIDIVKCLLVRGADYTITNFHKKGTYTIRNTARDVAVEEKNPEIIKLIDNMKVFEKKKEKETKELEVYLVEQNDKKKQFEENQVKKLKEFRKSLANNNVIEINKNNSNNNNTTISPPSTLQEFTEFQDVEKAEFLSKQQIELDDFYSAHKSLRNPSSPTVYSQYLQKRQQQLLEEEQQQKK